MVDISTPHFLELLHLISGARYAYYTEMHFSRAIIEHAHRLHSLIGPPRSNVVVQLGGSDPKEMARAASILEEQGYGEININVGCPSKAVQHGQFGAVLMKTPGVVAEIVQAMQQAVSIPVTIKCRLGVDQLDSFDFLYNFVDTIHKSNTMPHLIVHARKCILRGLSPKQNRSIPPLDYDRVFQLADTFPDIPISINGGFTEANKVKQVLDRLDGCMIGRKVMDYPLFLQELDHVIHDIPSHELKSIKTIIDDYIGKVISLCIFNHTHS
ncbi:FMN-linked oxidoreductase [Lichtheimia hyalospora FSU 10163]|nr:FMN-linked oxidoreductase [Lichtheimia hyalospora FSU 10163]